MQNLILLHSLQGRPPIMDAMGDAVLQQLLQQGLSAYQRDAAQQPVPTPALQLDSALLTSPEFRMYCYKARTEAQGAGTCNWGFEACLFHSSLMFSLAGADCAMHETLRPRLVSEGWALVLVRGSMVS
jgi:hypothetical protein